MDRSNKQPPICTHCINCKRNLITQPVEPVKCLECLHIICKLCVERVGKKAAKRTFKITCPVCKKITSKECKNVHEMYEKLQDNFYVEQVSVILSGNFRSCQICGLYIQEGLNCTTCDQNLCHNCVPKHVKNDDDHLIRQMKSSIEKYCTDHRESQKHFCKTCGYLVCVKCIPDHAEHPESIVLTEQAVRKDKTDVLSKSKVWLENITKKIEIIKHVNLSLDRAEENLQQWVESVKRKIDNDERDMKERIQDKREANENIRKVLEECRKLLEENIQHLENSQIHCDLEKIALLKQRIQINIKKAELYIDDNVVFDRVFERKEYTGIGELKLSGKTMSSDEHTLKTFDFNDFSVMKDEVFNRRSSLRRSRPEKPGTMPVTQAEVERAKADVNKRKHQVTKEVIIRQIQQFPGEDPEEN